MRIQVKILCACMLITAVPAAWPSGAGPMSGSMPDTSDSPREQSPEAQAQALYNKGVRVVGKADKYQNSAKELTDSGKQERALRKAHDLYAEALEKFQQAVEYDSHLHAAWNYVGYTNRKLGHYDVALTAYERALALHPGYPEALEYRGEAYLGLNRINDAQQAYLDLFASDRALAGKLLAAMKDWLETQRNSANSDANAVNEWGKWIQERAQIAGQTAGLSREGTAARWN